MASFTMVVEFISCYKASNHGIIWFQKFFTVLRIVIDIEKPLKLFCDNKLAVMYSNNNKSNLKSKHVDVKFLAMKEMVHKG